MYHHDEFVTPIPPATGKGRAVMVAPPTVPPPGSNNTGTMSSTGSSNSDAVKFAVPASSSKDNYSVENKENNATPSSTPTTSRKSRRRSNLFTPSKKTADPGKYFVQAKKKNS